MPKTLARKASIIKPICSELILAIGPLLSKDGFRKENRAITDSDTVGVLPKAVQADYQPF